MKTRASLLCVVGIVLGAAASAAGQTPAGPAAPPPTELIRPDPEEGWWRWPSLPAWLELSSLTNEANRLREPDRDGFTHWFIPIELYAEYGPVFELGRGNFSHALAVGQSIEVGAKNYLYDPDRSGAWLGNLALDFTINQSLNQHQDITHHTVPVTLDYVYRSYGVVGIGREWYYSGQDLPQSWRYVFGADVDGRLGHARAHFIHGPIREEIPQGNGNVLALTTLNVWDIPLAVSVGARVGVVMPFDRFDVLLVVRVDYQHEWISIDDHEKHLDEIKLLFSASIRY